MPAETKLLASTGLLFGTISILLFLTPFFLYSKKNREIVEDGVIKIAGEILFLHISLVVLAVLFTTAIDVVVVKPEFKPSNGIKYFFGVLNGGNGIMWEYWLPKSVEVAVGGVKDKEVMGAFIVMMKYYSVIIYFLCAAIPLAVLWNTVGSIVGQKKNDQNHYQGYFHRIQSGAISFFASTFAVIMHTSIASLYVYTSASTNVDFFKMINTAWHTILFG